MTGALKQAVAQRLSGDRPSAPRALLAASATGAAAAVITYRVLRS
jgi:hypothetical protein